MRLAFLVAAGALGCGAANLAEGAAATFSVSPHDTDPAIRQFDQPHRMFLDAAAATRGQLLVFLPGTGATTEGQDQFGRAAAGVGYHVIYLMYPNDVPAAVCQDDADEGSFEKFRREIIAGGDRDPRVTVERTDSIENRLLQLVRWLATHRAAEGWEQFLARDSVDWSKVVLAGHSQGGGHALLMAKDHAVARVIALGAPKDYTLRYGRPAAWYGSGATPASRIFAMVHEKDTQAVSFEQQLANLRASGLATVSGTDGIAPPYGHAHVLTTHAGGEAINSGLAHLGLVFDFMLPAGEDGRPAYRPAWIYLLTTPVD